MFAETTIETTINTLNGRNGQLTCWKTVDRTTSLKRMFVDNINIPDHNGNQGLALNPCPPTITNDPGYALYTDDRYYSRNGLDLPSYWWAAALGFGISDGNSTRAPTRAKLLQRSGALRCASDNCERRLDAVGRDEHGNYKLRSAPVAYETVTGAPSAAVAAASETGGPAQQAASLCATATVAASTESGGSLAETGLPARWRGRHDRRAHDEYYQPHTPTHAPVVTFENRR
jgi:hypothetical protein